MVDEFGSQLSSECDTLAHHISGEAHTYVATDSALAGSQTQRLGNRTTSEVLNGLKRPSGTPLTNSYSRDSKSHVQHSAPKLQAGTSRNREQGRDLRFMKEAKSAALQALDDLECLKGMDPNIDDELSRELENRGGSANHMVPKGRRMHDVEVLSSDSASEDHPRARAKHPARRRGTQPTTKGRKLNSHGRTRRMVTRSPF